jgi:hypothetical protein
MIRYALCMLVASGLLASADFACAQMPPQKIAGTIVKLDGLKLEVKPLTGEPLTITLADNFRLSARSAAGPAKLRPGTFVGTTAVTQPDGTLLASEVHVFPDSMRGTGEGHRPLDSQPGSTMTNATIAGVASGDAPRGAIANATVTGVSATAHARRLTLTYKGGEKTVIVPDAVPIAMVEPSDRSLLVPGAHVIVYAAARPDGSLAADRLTVGMNGFVPPP